MIHYFPAELPEPSSYSEPMVQNRVEFTPSIGPTTRRKKVTASGEVVVSVSYHLSGEEVDVLREFYNVTTDGGNEQVAFAHPQKNRTANGGVGEWTLGYLTSVEIEWQYADTWLATCEFTVPV